MAKFCSFLESLQGLVDHVTKTCHVPATHTLSGLGSGLALQQRWWASQIFISTLSETQLPRTWGQLKATKCPGRRDLFWVVICRILETKQVADILDHNACEDLEWPYWKPSVFLARLSYFSMNLVGRVFVLSLPSNHPESLHAFYGNISVLCASWRLGVRVWKRFRVLIHVRYSTPSSVHGRIILPRPL